MCSDSNSNRIEEMENYADSGKNGLRNVRAWIADTRHPFTRAQLRRRRRGRRKKEKKCHFLRWSSPVFPISCLAWHARTHTSSSGIFIYADKNFLLIKKMASPCSRFWRNPFGHSTKKKKRKKGKNRKAIETPLFASSPDRVTHSVIFFVSLD